MAAYGTPAAGQYYPPQPPAPAYGAAYAPGMAAQGMPSLVTMAPAPQAMTMTSTAALRCVTWLLAPWRGEAGGRWAPRGPL